MSLRFARKSTGTKANHWSPNELRASGAGPVPRQVGGEEKEEERVGRVG
jgi:hypothetical protein